MKTEPVLWVNMTMSAIRSLGMFAVAMGWITLTKEQGELALTAAATILPLVDYAVSAWIRRRVTPA